MEWAFELLTVALGFMLVNLTPACLMGWWFSGFWLFRFIFDWRLCGDLMVLLDLYILFSKELLFVWLPFESLRFTFRGFLVLVAVRSCCCFCLRPSLVLV